MTHWLRIPWFLKIQFRLIGKGVASARNLALARPLAVILTLCLSPSWAAALSAHENNPPSGQIQSSTKDVRTLERPYLALGVANIGEKEALKTFSEIMSERLQRPVVNYFDFGVYEPEVRPKSDWEWVELVLFTAVRLSPNEPILLFNLDGISEDSVQRQPLSFTSRELILILRTPELFKATRWFRKTVELSPKDVLAEFESLI
ncbi:MAG: hypothetical protein AB7P49_11750 [Bdellovibrionales bacterium]